MKVLFAAVLLAVSSLSAFGAAILPPTKTDCDNANTSANGYKSDAEDASAAFIKARIKMDIRYKVAFVKYTAVLCNLTTCDKDVLDARIAKYVSNYGVMDGYVTLAHDQFGYGIAHQKVGTGWYNESLWGEALAQYQDAETNYSNAKTQYNNAYGMIDTTLLDDMEAILANY